MSRFQKREDHFKLQRAAGGLAWKEPLHLLGLTSEVRAMVGAPMSLTMGYHTVLQPPLLNFNGLQPGSVVGLRLQQTLIRSFVKVRVWHVTFLQKSRNVQKLAVL